MAPERSNEIERWHEIKDQLDAILNLAPEQRPAYLDQISAADPELRQELESLIASHEQAGTDFLNVAHPQAPDPSAPNDFDPDHRDPMIGRRLGTYEIVEQIGEGGMGEVYRAIRADDQYRKQVAIKLVRANQNSDFVIRRFKNERQILATLDHPNIARLLDGGTTEEGIPYFVMELIEGQPIIEYCDSRNLPIAERLKLFVAVCSAVQYAHQRLIVHRDIKPGNILVTHEGTPKLLDFGIAKIVDADSETGPATLTIFRALTPGYASPEQVKGEPITTASDVYSLGVVLYELLTGQHPYSAPGSTPHQIAQAVCEVDPEKPSGVVRRTGGSGPSGAQSSVRSATAGTFGEGSADRLSKRLSGDLDNIVLMALRKEPERRYASVDKFAEDLRRHLANLPVFARKDTAGYRISKFVARHRAGVAATVAAIAILVVGIVVTVREAQIAREQASIARAQRARAEARFNDVRKLANSLMFEVHDSIKDLPGSTPARKLLVTRALEYLDSLSREASADVSLQRELASAYERVGDVQGYFYRSNLGDTAGALQSYQKAVAIREALAKSAPNDLGVQSDLADSYAKIASVEVMSGETQTSVDQYRQSLSIREMLARAEPLSEDARFKLANTHDAIGDALADFPDWKGALEEYKEGLVEFVSLSTVNPKDVSYRRMIALTKTKVGFVFENTDRIADALKQYQEALAILKALVLEDPSNALLQHNLAFTHLDIGDILAKLREYGPARKEYLEAVSIDEQLSHADPADMRVGRNLAMTYAHMGDNEMKAGQPEGGLQAYRKALALAEKRSAADPGDGDARATLANLYRRFGEFYLAKASREELPIRERQAYWQEARSWFQKDLDAWIDVQKHFSMSGSNNQKMEQARESVQACDAALSKLHSSDSDQIGRR
jgi:serine/threonine protein kinase/tetratricopeptide (TPR) repeat protein